jgi:hypothetical protein
LGQLGQNLTWLDPHLLGLTLSLEKTRSLFPFNRTRSLWRKGQNFELDKKEIRFNGVKQNIGFNNLCFVDLRLEADISKGTIVLAPDLTFGKGHLVSNPNIKKRIEEGLSSWKILSCKHEFETIKEKSRYIVRRCCLCNKIEKEWK